MLERTQFTRISLPRRDTFAHLEDGDLCLRVSAADLHNLDGKEAAVALREALVADRIAALAHDLVRQLQVSRRTTNRLRLEKQPCAPGVLSDWSAR